MASIASNGQPIVTYRYDSAGRPILKTFGNGMSAALSYDSASRLARVTFSGGPLSSPLDLIYQWDSASQLTSRTWNGQTQQYSYDPSGQLLTVSELASREGAKAAKEEAANPKSKIENPKLLESYSYDKAGNMIEKTVAGQKTTMTYDSANQLATSSTTPVALASLPMRLPSSAQPPSTATFTYDHAGRLVTSTGGPTRTYGWLDKVTKLTTPTGDSLRFSYWPDGQLAAKKMVNPQISQMNADQSIQQVSTKSVISAQSPDERFIWDGLALLRRDDTIYIIEPHPSGGIPIASHPVNKPAELNYYLNDMLGTTLATVEGSATRFASLTAFGQRLKAAPPIPKPGNLDAPTAPDPRPQTPSLPRNK